MSTSATQGGHNNLLICRTECDVADVVVCINWVLAALICATRRHLAPGRCVQQCIPLQKWVDRWYCSVTWQYPWSPGLAHSSCIRSFWTSLLSLKRFLTVSVNSCFSKKPFKFRHITSFYEETAKLHFFVIYTVSQKNVPPLACYNFDAHEWILIFFWQKCYR